MVADRCVDEIAVSDRADDLGSRRRHRVHSHCLVPFPSEPRHQGLAQPSRRTGHQDAHGPLLYEESQENRALDATICAVAYSFLAVDTTRSVYRANTVRFEVKNPHGVAM